MVEEDQYRNTYRNVNERRCVFEKAILSRRCDCMCATRFYLADREGIACDASSAHNRCGHLIRLLRENAKFALKITAIEGELPHAKEINCSTCCALISLPRTSSMSPGSPHWANGLSAHWRNSPIAKSSNRSSHSKDAGVPVPDADNPRDGPAPAPPPPPGISQPLFYPND